MVVHNDPGKKWLAGILIGLSVLILLIIMGSVLVDLLDISLGVEMTTTVTYPGQGVKTEVKTIGRHGTPLELAFARVVVFGRLYLLLPLCLLNIIMGSIASRKGSTIRKLAITSIIVGALTILIVCSVLFWALAQSGFELY